MANSGSTSSGIFAYRPGCRNCVEHASRRNGPMSSPENGGPRQAMAASGARRLLRSMQGIDGERTARARRCAGAFCSLRFRPSAFLGRRA
jgi:hypothetical protein